MDFNHLLYQVNGGVATVTLNRPNVYNALNDEITYELQDVWNVIAEDDTIRVAVLTGAGKAFCSGQDLKDASESANRSFRASLVRRYNPIIRSMRALPKPIVCRLNGVAAGAGCSLALACDVIVADEAAVLTEAFVNIGLVPDSGSSYFLPRMVGTARAFELCSQGKKITARQAFEWGMINYAVPASSLDEVVREQVSFYSVAPTRAIGLIKQMLNKSTVLTLDEMLEYESYCQEIAGRTEDHQEGVKAFLEKRQPRFSGQ
jgi:2-(1,2-epoxy-1,2-dihydrophenyl)acetyl-CoA isomerase